MVLLRKVRNRPKVNGTYLRASTRLYGQLLMPEGRVEFAKTPVGSNSFDRGYPANSQWSNEFDPTGEGFAGARGLK